MNAGLDFERARLWAFQVTSEKFHRSSIECRTIDYRVAVRGKSRSGDGTAPERELAKGWLRRRRRLLQTCEEREDRKNGYGSDGNGKHSAANENFSPATSTDSEGLGGRSRPGHPGRRNIHGLAGTPGRYASVLRSRWSPAIQLSLQLQFLLEPLQINLQLFNCLIALFPFFGQSFFHHPLEFHRNLD